MIFRKLAFVLCFVLLNIITSHAQTSAQEMTAKSGTVFKESLGEQIKDARKSKDLSIDELAIKLDISIKNLSNIEENRAVPTRELIVDIEDILKCEIILDSGF